MRFKYIAIYLLCTIKLFSLSELDDMYEFNDIIFEEHLYENTSEIEIENSSISGTISEQIAYSWLNESPHESISSLKSSLFLEYNNNINENFKIRINMKAYYDAIYNLKGKDEFSDKELSELHSEIEIFDAYIEGSIIEGLDVKLGRQIIVWGRSDTLRVTDVLNPIDNRRPGMVDVKDLRLPVLMLKLDYSIGDNWRFAPIFILEQCFTKSPPFGSAFYPESTPPQPENETYSDITYALSLSGEFGSWDVSLYASKLRDFDGYIEVSNLQARTKHELVDMQGCAINYLKGSWLFKSELAHKDGLKYTSAPNQEFNSFDILFGTEYYGIRNTMLSYDVSYKKIGNYLSNLLSEPIPIEENTYQHAFRARYEYKNSTIIFNYLIALEGSEFENGGYQRVWTELKITDDLNIDIGVIDYIGGSKYFDSISRNDTLFGEVKYSF